MRFSDAFAAERCRCALNGGLLSSDAPLSVTWAAPTPKLRDAHCSAATRPRPAATAAAPGADCADRKLLIGNLPRDMDETVVYCLMAAFGTVQVRARRRRPPALDCVAKAAQ